MVAQDAHCGNHARSSLDCWHHGPLEPCAPGEFRVFESVGCLQLLLFCRHCCNSDGRFATLFQICGYDCSVTARLKFVWQGRVYIRCRGEGVGGGRTTSILAVRVWLFGSSGPSHLCGWDSPAPMWAASPSLRGLYHMRCDCSGNIYCSDLKTLS